MSSQAIKPITRNANAASSKELAPVEASVQSEIIRPVEILANQYSFEGSYATESGETTLDESIRLSVSLVNTGEETRERGVFVAATKLRALSKKEDAQSYKDSLRAQFVLEAKEKAIAAFIPDPKLANETNANRLEVVRKQAEDSATITYNNIVQSIGTAILVLEDPSLLPTHKSVFRLSTYTQAKAYLSMPSDKDDNKDEKLAIRSKVIPLLKSGATQKTVRDAIAKVKTARAESEVKRLEAKLTPEQVKKADADLKTAKLEERTSYLASKVIACASEWSALINDLTAHGETAESAIASLRKHSNSRGDASKGTITDSIATLARLAGLKIQP